MTEKKYNNVTFTVGLLDEVDAIVANQANGYRSRNEFCVDAVRRLVLNYKNGNKNYQPENEKTDGDKV